MINWKRKLTSRKFWLAIANFVTQLLILLKVAESQATQIAAIIMLGGGVVGYLIGEGLADNSTTIMTETDDEKKETTDSLEFNALYDNMDSGKDI